MSEKQQRRTAAENEIRVWRKDDGSAHLLALLSTNMLARMGSEETNSLD